MEKINSLVEISQYYKKRKSTAWTMFRVNSTHYQEVQSAWRAKQYDGSSIPDLTGYKTHGETYVPQSTRTEKDTCSHKFRRIGYVNKRDARERKVTATCDNPVLFQCMFCLSCYDSNCGSRDISECKPCEERYRLRVRAIVRIPLMAANPGTALLVTFTAPGRKRHCLSHTYKDKDGKIQPSVKCDWEAYDRNDLIYSENPCIECPCSENNISHRDDLAIFNSMISRRFNDFITEIRRSVPGFEGVQYFRAVEPQKRGALHIHAIFVVKRAMKIDTDTRAILTRIAMRLGFGHQLDIKRLPANSEEKMKTARYIAKYVSKSEGHGRIPFWDEGRIYEDDGTVTSVSRFRPNTWSSSRGWGVSMKRLVSQQMIFRMGFKEQAEMHLEEGRNGLQRFRELQDSRVSLLKDYELSIPDLILSKLAV